MGIELLERAVKGGGQLLRAEASPVAGQADRVAVLLLTFDLGRIAVSADVRAAALRIEYVASAERTPQGLRDVSEEEPWWRVLGSPIARVWPVGPEPEGALRVQFRADDKSPRVVGLAPRAGAVAIRLEEQRT